MAQKAQNLSSHFVLYWLGRFLHIFVRPPAPLALAGCFCYYHFPVLGSKNSTSVVQGSEKGRDRENYFSYPGMDVCNSHTPSNHCQCGFYCAHYPICDKPFLFHLCHLHYVRLSGQGR